MKALHSLYIKKEVLQKILDVLNKKQGKDSNGIELTISTGNDPNQYEQTVSGWISQTKEQREAGKEKFYVGNGKTFWTNVSQAPKEQPNPKEEDKGINADDNDSLPF